MFNKIKILSIFLIFSGMTFAQSFSVQAKIDTAEMFIGEQRNLIFEINQRSDIQVISPVFADTLISGIEILEHKSDTIKSKDNNSLTVKQIYTITSFDSALYYIPPYQFINGNDTILTGNLSLKVLTVDVDTTQISENKPPFDIKSIVNAPFNWELFKKIAIWVIPIWFLIALIIWLVIRYTKKHQPKEQTKEEIKRSAHEIALEKLNVIRNEKIWQQGRSKEYYTQITDVLREYIENRFDVPTFEKTSAEIIDSLHFAKKEYKESISRLKKILSDSDLVKFAKFTPDFDQHTRSLNDAQDFVSETVIKEIEEIQEENTVEKL
ncbi:MAG: hypothetical protein LBN95_08720 [Prevotellaceae bacterium]|jgi:hypothetical protein|nr:hypothetical protein [Prevotellaceae bacterium]